LNRNDGKEMTGARLKALPTNCYQIRGYLNPQTQ